MDGSLPGLFLRMFGSKGVTMIKVEERRRRHREIEIEIKGISELEDVVVVPEEDERLLVVHDRGVEHQEEGSNRVEVSRQDVSNRRDLDRQHRMGPRSLLGTLDKTVAGEPILLTREGGPKAEKLLGHETNADFRLLRWHLAIIAYHS